MTKKLTIYLIPTALSPEDLNNISPQIKEVVAKTDHYFVEELRTARRFIGSLKTGKIIDNMQFSMVNKKTTIPEINEFFAQIPDGSNVGIMSEAGCPAIADPGTLAVNIAHQNGWRVVPLVGASSIFLALMASGLGGQQFAFNGYLPIDQASRALKIKELERESQQKWQTQIFMETPYRNNILFRDLVKLLNPQTQLCAAVNLTAENEWIRTKKVSEWRKIDPLPDFHKMPCMFVMLA